MSPGLECPICRCRLTPKVELLQSQQAAGSSSRREREDDASRQRVLVCSNPRCAYRRTGHGMMG